ncbi:VOC family protein [Streptomyces sp. WI04-05B]|uniref:VOC family protein n=1 Tax=Streptomyces TaxID=1883 RepID=UPI0029B70664|nr:MULTISPECIES: VOC family protein [unclassified Streptomyces]MDX2546101.1 VOC family protein [Streptomyces sp. WI04-05B]MDX2587209.1 VOC family protein [Streptomyces sp. WI04-05A]MDX3752639.1 VOC family protein [Streptomyces sp. AK08-02]
MPEVTAEHYQPGTPCWVDLMAPDQQAALDFYRDLFGWQGEIGPPEFGGYAMCTLNGKAVAGIMKAQPMNDGDPTPPTVWTTYLASADADATQAAITAAGGTVMFPVMDVGTVGRMLVAVDPTGAAFGVWQPVDFYGAQLVNEAGALTWNELHTPDIPAAKAFYAAALGIGSEPMEGVEEYHAITVGGRAVGGLTAMGEQAPPGTPPHWLTYFSVDDTDSTVDALVRAGGNVLVPPFDFVAGRMSVVTDPQGAVFAVIKAVPM